MSERGTGMITMKNGMVICLETAWATNLQQSAIGVVADPLILPERQATVVRVIEAIYESARTGQVVHLHKWQL